MVGGSFDAFTASECGTLAEFSADGDSYRLAVVPARAAGVAAGLLGRLEPAYSSSFFGFFLGVGRERFFNIGISFFHVSIFRSLFSIHPAFNHPFERKAANLVLINRPHPKALHSWRQHRFSWCG